MPTVPRRDPTQIEGLKPLPGVSYTSGATEETFGGGASNLALGKAGHELAGTSMKLLITAQDATDTAYVEKADIGLTSERNRIMKTMAEDYQGENAVKIPDFYQAEWSKVTEDALKNAPNENAKSKLQKRLGVYYGQLDSHGQQMMFQRNEEFKLNSMEAQVASAKENGALNWKLDDIVNSEYTKMIAARESYSKTHGLFDTPEGKAIHDQKVNIDKSDFTKNVITKMLADNDVKAAENYWEKNKDQIEGKDADAFSKYIDSEKNKIVTMQAKAKEESYNAENRNIFLQSFKTGVPSMGDLQWKYREDLITEADFNAWANRSTNPEFQAYRDAMRADRESQTGNYTPYSDPDIFNEIRSAIATNSMSRAELDRKIRDASGPQKKGIPLISEEDAYVLMQENDGKERGPRDQKIKNQMDRIMAWGEKNLHTGLAMTAPGINLKGLTPAQMIKMPGVSYTTKEERTKQASALAAEFVRRVYKEKAKDEKIDDIAKQVIFEELKKEDPSLEGYESMAEVNIETDGKVNNVWMTPQKTDKPKPLFRITRVANPKIVEKEKSK